MEAKIKIIDGGTMPKKAHKEDAAFDCYARLDEDVVIQPTFRAKIPLGFAVGLPDGWEVQIRPRSGLTSKGIDNGWGTGDAGFIGEYCAVVINNSHEPFTVHNGDRICQMVIKKLDEVELVEAEELSETDRGSDGFGSTGV